MADMFDKEELGIVGSLFGTTPEALQLARENTAYTRGTSAGTNLLGGILGQAGMFAERGAAGLRGALGQQTQEEQMLGLRKQAQQQFDTNTPEGLVQMAQFLNKSGDAAGARQAILLAQGQQQAGANLAKTQAEEQAKLREPLPNIAKLQAYRTNLIAKFGENDPRVKEVDAEIAGLGKKGQTEINLGGIFDKMFTKKEAEDQAETWNKAGQAYADASKLARSVREMEAVVGNAFVGSYGSLKAGVSRALGGGKKLEDTEVLDALSAQLVLPLAKLLPGSLAVKELDQLIKTKPNLNQQEATIRRLLGTINQDLRASEITYEAGEKYRAANGGKINGFNPYIANNKATRLTELESIYKNTGKLTDSQKKEAKSIADELQVGNM